MIKRLTEKTVVEKEYDDIEHNRVMEVNVIERVKFFGATMWTRKYLEKLEVVDGGEYKSRNNKIGFYK